MRVTVHYENDRMQVYDSENPTYPHWRIGYVFNKETGVFYDSKMNKKSGYFEVVEKSTDGKDVWVEYHD